MIRMMSDAISSFSSSAQRSKYQSSSAEARGDFASASRYNAQSSVSESIVNKLVVSSIANDTRKW